MTVPRPRSSESPTVPISRDPIMPEPTSEPGISVVDIFSILLRYRVLIVLVGLAFGLYTGRQVMQLPRFYKTDAEFMPQGARGQSQISGLARQFGISIGSEGGDSPQFYMDLIRSRSILGEVAKKDYEMRTDTRVVRGNLIKIFGGARLKPQQQGPFAVARLKSLVDVRVSGKTGVITLTVRARTAELATQIANNILVQINTFNLNRRQQQAGAERAFVEDRLGESQMQLRDAEVRLESFLLQNRGDFSRSPTLQFEHSRLRRKVDERQSVYTALAAAYEQAKIEEVRDLPVITVLAPPELPLAPESKSGARKVVFSIIVGLFLGAMLAFAKAGLAATTRGHTNDVAEFDRLKKETLGDVLHPWRPIVRAFSWRRRRQAAA